jgi:probable O-glycosylation ligase (exosortase A-associated)
MRDIFVTLVVLGSLPFILRRPWIGIIMWSWLSYMNPHKQAWGFATTMPFALLVALATLVGVLMMKEDKRIPWTRETILLLSFFLWMVLTTFFALNPDGAWEQLDKVWRIQLMTFVTLMLITSKVRLKAFVWIITLSIAYYGVKGGIFTILTGGVHRVWGPSGTFIGGNNEIGLALIMIIPLLRFLQLDARNPLLRLGLVGAMFLCAVAAIGTQSRGAFIAIVAMGAFLWLKSRHKVALGAIGVVTVLVVLSLMPEQYYERLTTIRNYEDDASAMGRINAWWFAWNLALSRPLVGGGFEVFRPWIFASYAPNPWQYHDAHSIYFEVLGEHGFVGLALFLGFFGCGWLSAGQIRRQVTGDADNRWKADLASMVQVSLVGYAVGGLFLGLAYFDLPYHLVCIIVIIKAILAKERAEEVGPAAAKAPGPAAAVPRLRTAE